MGDQLVINSLLWHQICCVIFGEINKMKGIMNRSKNGHREGVLTSGMVSVILHTKIIPGWKRANALVLGALGQV